MLRYEICPQSRSGGGGGIQTSGYDGAQFDAVVVVVLLEVVAVIVVRTRLLPRLLQEAPTVMLIDF
jgi:hypothetical protein